MIMRTGKTLCYISEDLVLTVDERRDAQETLDLIGNISFHSPGAAKLSETTSDPRVESATEDVVTNHCSRGLGSSPSGLQALRERLWIG